MGDRPRLAVVSPLFAVLAITAVACGDPSQTSPTNAHLVSPSTIAPPVAHLEVAIDDRGSEVAISNFSNVRFDLSASTGLDLRYSVEAGDGSPRSDRAVSSHIYDLSNNLIQVFSVRATVTDA